MKKILCMLLVLVGVSSWAQSETGLKGVWQRCVLTEVGGKVLMELQPEMKMINSDGTFSNLVMRTTEGGCFTSTRGTYELTSDSTYTEVVKNSVYPELMGLSNQIRFLVSNNDWLYISYRNEQIQGDKYVEEVWKRVVMK